MLAKLFLQMLTQQIFDLIFTFDDGESIKKWMKTCKTWRTFQIVSFPCRVFFFISSVCWIEKKLITCIWVGSFVRFCSYLEIYRKRIENCNHEPPSWALLNKDPMRKCWVFKRGRNSFQATLTLGVFHIAPRLSKIPKNFISVKHCALIDSSNFKFSSLII